MLMWLLIFQDPSASLDVVELDEVPDPVGKNVG